METLPVCTEVQPMPVKSESARKRRELQPEEISTRLSLTEPRKFTDEELELLEMRYQQALALMNLENIFAEGMLDGR
jgi:hypothetical protein